jgi:predicted nucleotidyltransferase
MISRVSERAVEAVPIALRDSLGERLRALYLYGTLAEGRERRQQSDINLFAVVADDVTLHEIRQAFRPTWRSEFSDLRIALLVARLSSFERHLKLNPVLARDLAQRASLRVGADLLPRPQAVSSVEKLASVANEAMLASSALAPNQLSSEAANASLAALYRLASMYLAISDLEDWTAAKLMAGVQYHLSREMRRQELPLYREKSIARKPLIIPDLQAIYETENRIVLVLPDLSPERIGEAFLNTDWAEVSKRVKGKYGAVRVTTAGQLRLILEYEAAADYLLQSYDHAWGKDPIGGMNVSDWRVFRQLARMPSRLQLATLPREYIVADEPSLPMLIHDFQNMLLNIQLRSELIGKITGRALETPPIGLPDRNAPSHGRVAAIHQHLGWWSDYHTSLMERLLPDSS